MEKQENRSSPDAVVISDNTDGIFAVDVEVKVAGLDMIELASTGKVFQVNGRKHPMSRFGSWVFQGDADLDRQICIDGGIIASLTWGLQQICPQIEVWVKDVEANSFSLQMKESQKTAILEKIVQGNIAKDLEKVLRDGIPRIYADIRIVLVRIVGKASRNGAKSNGSAGEEVWSRVAILRDLELISHLMNTENFGLAYGRLMKLIDSKISDSERVQMLLRLGICSFHLDKVDEMENSALRVQRLTEKMEDSAPPMEDLVQDIAVFSEHLENSGLFTCAAEMMLGCNRLIHKTANPNKLLNDLLTNIMMCCALMKATICRNGMVRTRAECRKYIQMLEKEVQFLQGMKECDELDQSRAIYYSLHMINGLREDMGEPASTTSKGFAGLRFSCIESSWADLTTVLSLGEKFPEIAMMFIDSSFMKTVKEISENPALLEKRIMDPRICKINAILNRDFFKATPMTGFTRSGIGRFEDVLLENMLRQHVAPPDKKTQIRIYYDALANSDAEQAITLITMSHTNALKEKEKGNEAYKKKQYKKALEHYDRAIGLHSSDALLHSNKASVYISMNQLGKAKECCLTALRVAQSNESTDDEVVAKILARLARVEHLSLHYDAALSFYQKSLRLNDDTKVREQMKKCKDEAAALEFLDDFTDLMFDSP